MVSGPPTAVYIKISLIYINFCKIAGFDNPQNIPLMWPVASYHLGILKATAGYNKYSDPK